MEILGNISASLQKGDFIKVADYTRQAIDNNLEPKIILDDGLISGMAIIGEKFKKHEIFLPDVLLAAKAMYAGMELLKPLMIKEGIPSIGKVVIGSVYGDLHDIGKNLVGIMLKGAGFEVIDLGNNVSAQDFIDTAEKSHADLIGMSALLTTTMPVMKQTIELAKEQGLYGKVKFIIGGAPLSSDYAAEIGADAYCFDGINAVDRAKELLGVR